MAKNWPFSNRWKFYKELERILCVIHEGGDKEYRVVWPDAIGRLTPEAICRAALLACVPDY